MLIKRRQGAGRVVLPSRSRITGRPAKITREQARGILEECTEVVKVGKAGVTGGEEVREASVETGAGKGVGREKVNASSALEREW